MNWEKEFIDAGVITEKGKKDITFKATNDIPVITHLHSSCGCSTPTYDEVLKVLRVIYTAPMVSSHLRATTKKNIITQQITVTYADGTKDILSFTITVKMK